MSNRNYSNVAPPVVLTVAVTTASTTLTVPSTTGYPAVPFLIGIERGTPNEEVVLCTALTATTFTVTRGYDSTSAKTHAIGVQVEHCTAAIDYFEAGDHITSSTGVHGLAAGVAVVGTTSAQTLTNKTIDGASNTISNLTAAMIASGTLDAARIPNLDAAKITTGTFSTDRVPQMAYASANGRVYFSSAPSGSTTASTYLAMAPPSDATTTSAAWITHNGTQLLGLSKTGVLTTSGLLDADTVGGRKLWVQGTDPGTSAKAGDLWFET